MLCNYKRNAQTIRSRLIRSPTRFAPIEDGSPPYGDDGGEPSTGEREANRSFIAPDTRVMEILHGKNHWKKILGTSPQWNRITMGVVIYFENFDFFRAKNEGPIPPEQHFRYVWSYLMTCFFINTDGFDIL